MDCQSIPSLSLSCATETTCILRNLKPFTHNALLLLLIFFIQDGADLKGMKVMIKDLDDVLFRDVGGKIAADGRWDWLLTCINHAYISKYSNLYNTLAWRQNTFTPNISLLVVTDGPS